MDISSLLIIRTVHTVLNYSRLSVLRTKYLVCGQTLNGFTSFVNPFESKSGQEQEMTGQRNEEERSGRTFEIEFVTTDTSR